MANALQDRYAEMLLDRIAGDKHPSATHMDMFEAVASDRLLVAYVLHLLDRLEDETHPSIPMMQRVQRVIARFG